MADVTNFWPDPKFVSSDETTILAYNYFENPSPVSALTGWNVAGTATVTLDAGASIKGAGGVEVVSPNGTSGVSIAIPETKDGVPNWRFNFTVYVRAHAAMTLTGSATTDLAIGSVEAGWGDFGWGEEFSYVEGASHTFEAGEVKRFRISPATTSSASATRNWAIKLLGTGTFDVDAAWLGGYVRDGLDPAEYPGGNWDIPNAPLYFDGATTDTDEFTYSWEGTANASRSIKRGNLPKYIASREGGGGGTVGHNNARTAILADDEPGFALQADWDFNTNSTAYFLGYGGDLKGLGLTEGSNYVLSVDVVSTYENYIEGYPGHLYDSLYFVGNGPAETGTTLPAVLRRRLHLPFTPGAGEVNNYLASYRLWSTGETFFTDASLFEVEFFVTVTPNGNPANLPLDLLAAGLEPGETYVAQYDRWMTVPGEHYTIEYQTGGGGSWITLAEDLYDPDYQGSYFSREITVPADATALRLDAEASQASFDADFFSVPPDPFNGDTPDGGGYSYSWSGTPYESASIRSDAAAGPTAQVFVGGVGKAVSEIRVMQGGSLIPITEAGA